MFRPTEEQQIAVDKFRTGKPLKIAAFAGAGKTTTLGMLAKARPSRGVYLAFNKAIANEASEKFPKNVDCRTTHSIAFRSVMPRYGSTAKMTKTTSVKQIASEMGYQTRVFPGPIRLDGVHQAYLVLATVRRFCQSAAPEITNEHVPNYGRLVGAGAEVISEIRTRAAQQARALWSRMTDAADRTPLGHDGYLKAWALARPRINADYVLLDEAQDTNAVVLDVLQQQDAQAVYVGDRHQQIYEWRGAVNAMEKIPGCEEAALTQSFRFGDGIAEAASRVLATLDEQRRIRGNPNVSSRISRDGRAKTVLARTNATVIMEVLEATRAGQRPFVCGGTKDITALLGDVYELKAGKPGVCPEFFGFQNWREVVEFAGSEEGESLRTFVQMVEQHGEAKLWAAVKKVVDKEDDADMILSTAHKAKGREWDSVRLTSDFLSTRLGSGADAASEVRLFYVAMTRAKSLLIVEPEVLQTFTTSAWKQKRPDPSVKQTPADTAGPSRTRQPMPEAATWTIAGVREIVRPGVTTRHPGAAAQSAQRAPPEPPQPQPRPTPPSPGPTLAARRIEERAPESVRKLHPAAPSIVPRGIGSRRAEKSPGGLWGRVTRLFRG